MKNLGKLLKQYKQADKERLKAEEALRKIQADMSQELKSTGEDKFIKEARKLDAGMLPSHVIRHIEALVPEETETAAKPAAK